MSARTGIEWTHRTWNPWQGCTKVSPGCARCYMFRDKARFKQDPAVVVRSRPVTFRAPLHWKAAPGGWRQPELVFTCSWSDWFHETADPWRDEAWAIVRSTPHLTYQILTKRPLRIREHLPTDWGDGYPNVWLGVSIENQHLSYRAIQLARIPARVRFISAEPLVGPLDLTQAALPGLRHVNALALPNGEIHWVIAGGESGPGFRPMAPAWAAALRDQCAHLGVAFFLKQMGGWPDKRGGHHAVLDGRQHLTFPRVAV